MANISAATNERTISLKQFLGLNENPDGDNKLKVGEASVCRNFKVTDNGNLKKRAGTVLKYTLGVDTASISTTSLTITSPAVVTATFKAKVTDSGTYVFAYDTDHWELDGDTVTISDYGISYSGTETDEDTLTVEFAIGTEKPIKGMWHGMCTHHELFIAACDGRLWMLQDDEFFKYPTDMGSISTANDVFMFGFDEKVFVMDGTNYHMVWYESNPTPASATIAAEIGQSSTLTGEAVDVDVFKTMVDAGGVYVFTFGDNGWFNGFDITSIVDLDDYGITYSGTAEVGDKLTVTYVAASLGAWNLSNLTDSTSPNYLAPYSPLVAIAIPPQPAGGGELLQQVNKLTPARRVWISADGVGDTFQLPEKDLDSIDYVKDLSTNTNLTLTTDYTVDTANGTVTFTSVPALAVNGYEIGYTAKVTFASTVGAMRYAELYAGTQDNRVFIYGDGSNRAFYSELDYNGHQRGDYFPDLNEVTVGDTNTPITSIIRHYSRLLAFKPNQTFSIDYGVVTLADGLMTMAFYTTPINRILGNEPLGQVQMVLNAPISLCEGNLYEWRSGSSYAANLSVDERQAKRISDKISATLRGMNLAAVHCYDDNLNSEYYIIDDKGNCLVHNYRADAWYYYTGLNARLVTAIDGVLWIGTRDGMILMMSDTKFSDMGKPIDCYWESGSLDFGASNMRKYSALMWVGLKAEQHNKVTVTAKTERSIENTEIEVEPDYENFMPRITRCKVKVKKFVFYKLCFMSNDASATVTVVDTEIKVRYTAQAK